MASPLSEENQKGACAVQRASEMSNSGAEEEEALSRAAKATEDLYHLRDTYFPPNPHDRTSKLQHHSDLLLKLLDSIPPGLFCFSSTIPTQTHLFFLFPPFYSNKGYR